ncbi:hypothetical protein GM31_21825 [Trabulsiella odontotermitis]|uniref:Uncharacterized protein n=1 Tax=Trabulsiella odontotermitis TaxID=379893 RepID=A0A0L0H456_9ENTR|nr:hypothetical protein GM31_21825 [Trabulsiella odontotermitis]
MLAKSSFTALSPTGISFIASGLPLGILINILRKLPTPLLCSIFSLIAFSISRLIFGSEVKKMNPICAPFRK